MNHDSVYLYGPARPPYQIANLNPFQSIEKSDTEEFKLINHPPTPELILDPERTRINQLFST